MKVLGGRKVLFIVFIFFILLGGTLAFFQYQSSPQSSNQPVPTVKPLQNVDDVPQQVTLEGEVICLPHKENSGPQTLECAIGLKSDDGIYYALDAGTTSMPGYTTGDRIRAKGLMTPIEQLSSDHWQKYAIKGIFSIKDDFEIL